MMPLLVASVPHTGTMFTYDLLPGKPAAINQGLKEDHKYVGHVDDVTIQEAASKCFTIIPMRSRDAVQESWRNRGMNTKRLEELWLILDRDEFSTAIRFHIDNVVIRNRQLRQLSDILGCPLMTDWKPTNRHITRTV